MKTIRDVFDYCVAAHAPDPVAAVRTICPGAVTTVWDHGDYGAAIGIIGAVVSGQTCAMMCFQGTKGTVRDWVRDFEIRPDDNGVDHGFHAEWLQYKDEVARWFPSADHLPVFSTGHSQGGPTAAQASEYINDEFCVPSCCITFGSPLWCNKMYRDRYDMKAINLTNVINPMDIVTRVDPKAERPGKTLELRNPWWHVFVPAFFFVEHTLEAYRRDLIRTEKVIGGD